MRDLEWVVAGLLLGIVVGVLSAVFNIKRGNRK